MIHATCIPATIYEIVPRRTIRRTDWETPWELFNPLHKEFNFTLDAAAELKNRKVEKFFSEADDAFEQDWGAERIWLNPPFGAAKMTKWVTKAFSSSVDGATVVMLIPSSTNTNWFHDIVLRHAEVRFVRGRPRFIGAKAGFPWPLMLVIFRPGGKK